MFLCFLPRDVGRGMPPVPPSSRNQEEQKKKKKKNRNDDAPLAPTYPSRMGGAISSSDERCVLKDVLSVIADAHRFKGDTWRAAAYAKAATVVASDIKMPQLDHPEQAAGVGKSIGDVIRKARDMLRSAPYSGVVRGDDLGMHIASALRVVTQQDIHIPLVRAYRLFIGILGIGDKKAMELVREGYRSVDDVRLDRRALHLDSPLHDVGLKYYDDLRSRMSNGQARDVANRVMRIVDRCRIEGLANDMTAPLGSLRRAKPTVGDVDILLLASDDEGFQALARRIPRLLREDLIFVLRCGDRRYSFIMSHQGRARQVDLFRAKDRSEWAAFLLYGTGSAAFNERMRAKARSRGMLLNEYGLHASRPNDAYILSSKGGKGVRDAGESSSCNTGRVKLPLHTEADIFGALGMEYIPPHMRD